MRCTYSCSCRAAMGKRVQTPKHMYVLYIQHIGHENSRNFLRFFWPQCLALSPRSSSFLRHPLLYRGCNSGGNGRIVHSATADPTDSWNRGFATGPRPSYRGPPLVYPSTTRPRIAFILGSLPRTTTISGEVTFPNHYRARPPWTTWMIERPSFFFAYPATGGGEWVRR